MKLLPTTLPDIVLLELDARGDQRGWFMETFQRDRYLDFGIGVGLEFVQDNFSSSARGILRGLHYQLHHPQGKLVWVTHGTVFDAAVDVRRGSPTFGRWFGTELSAENHRQMWIPSGYGHGFLVLSDRADFAYKVTATYDPDDERAVAWNDPEIAITWPLDGAPTLSRRDQAAPTLRAAELPTYSP